VIRDAGYGAVWRGQRNWNGVAILARDREPILVRDELPGDPTDQQSRYIEAAVHGVLIASIYLPNGNPQPGPKFAYKRAWFERLIAHAAEIWATGVLLQPESRAAFRRLLDQGWTDPIRTLHPAEPMYTFWDYKRDRWRRNAGLRLDFLLLSAALAGRLADAGVDREVRGREGASDHAPAWVVLR
jgi:exodeoxyribonuclease-3